MVKKVLCMDCGCPSFDEFPICSTCNDARAERLEKEKAEKAKHDICANDLRAIHREAFLAALGGMGAVFQDTPMSPLTHKKQVENSIALAIEALRQWPAACAERDAVIAELEGRDDE